ncbi:MAG: response regulator [Terriglobia bacterium]
MMMCAIAPNSVLLVDDDPAVRTLLARQLRKEGFETREAEDGIEGLVKLRNELPGVIISDLQMPRMSGFEFVSVVRRRFPCITVIVLSGSTPNDIPAESEPDVWFEKGALNFPILLQTLRELVRRKSEHPDLPQVVTRIRTQAGFAGYFMLTCPDCLRTFRATCAAGNETGERTAVCTHCEARVPFLVESSGPA